MRLLVLPTQSQNFGTNSLFYSGMPPPASMPAQDLTREIAHNLVRTSRQSFIFCMPYVRGLLNL